MDARTVDKSAAALSELHREGRDTLAVALLGFAGATVASQLAPSLVLPTLVTGAVMALFAGRALLRQRELLDRLTADRDAYAIRGVRMRGERAASMKHRRSFAASIRGLPTYPGVALVGRVAAYRPELALLADQLERPDLALDPFAAVACQRLLTDGQKSPLFNPELPSDALGTYLRQIRAGFESRQPEEEHSIPVGARVPVVRRRGGRAIHLP